MMDLIVVDLVGNTEMLTDATVTRKISETNEKTITITVMEEGQNQDVFPLMKNQCFVVYDNEEYVIKKLNFKSYGKVRKATLTAYHKFYEDFNDHRQYDTLTGTFRLEQFLEFIFRDIDYTYQIDYGNIPDIRVGVENFGDNNLITLLIQTTNRFKVEFEVQGKVVLIAKEHARYLDKQMRYEFNINDPNLHLDSTNLKTHIKGFGRQDEETGEYLAQAEYTSPLAQVYGIKHAQPVRDERFTNTETLLDEIKSRLTDYIPMSLTLKAIDLIEMGIKDVRKGDYVWCIIEPFDLDVQLRVVEVEDYSDESSPKFTFGTLKVEASQIINDWKEAKNTLNRIMDDGGLNYSALPGNVRESTQMVSMVSNAVGFTAEGFTTSDLVARSSTPDVLFGNGEIRASGETVISWRGVNLSVAYGDLSAETVEQITSQIELPTVELATEETDGLMARYDKRKLNQIIISEYESYSLSDFAERLNDVEERLRALENSD